MAGRFSNGAPDFYELYAGMGPCMGSHPAERDEDIASLTCAVVPLPDAEFYHFGTSRQMIESVSALQNRNLDQRGQSHLSLKPHPDMYVLNSDFAFSSRSTANKLIWVENCSLPAALPLASENVLTNLPSEIGDLSLESGVCVDTPPVGDSARCLRVYGFNDSFKGAIGDRSTRWLGEPIALWFEHRHGCLDVVAGTRDRRTTFRRLPRQRATLRAGNHRAIPSGSPSRRETQPHCRRRQTSRSRRRLHSFPRKGRGSRLANPPRTHEPAAESQSPLRPNGHLRRRPTSHTKLTRPRQSVYSAIPLGVGRRTSTSRAHNPLG